MSHCQFFPRMEAGILTLAFLSAAALLPAPALGQAVYNYGGSLPFDTVGGAYTTSDRVTGTFALLNRLAPNLPGGTDISALVIDYSFDDGVQTLTDINSYVVQFSVATDSFCRITEWSITAWQGDNPVAGIDTSFSTGPMGVAVENGFQGAPCGATSNGRCVATDVIPTMGTAFGTRFTMPGSAGTWTGPTCPETPPAQYSYGGSDPFDLVQGGYSTSDTVTGGFSIPRRLPPNLPAGTDITGQVLSYSFNDGVQTLTEDDSYIVRFDVATDSFCNITEWGMTVWQGDNPVAGIDTIFFAEPMGFADEKGFQGVPCGSTSGGRCVAMTIFPDMGTDFGTRFVAPGTAGSWTGPSCPETPPAQYTYGGSLPFDTVTGAYTTSDQVSGQFSLAGEIGGREPVILAPNLPPGTDIAGQVLNFSFNDGVQTLTDADSYLASFTVGTDSSCNIIDWSMSIWQGADPVAGIDTGFTPGPMGSASENGFQGAPCGATAGSRCVAVNVFPNLGTDFGTRFTFPGIAGTWTGPICGPTAVPALGPWGLALLLGMVAWIFARAVRKRVRSR